MSSPTTTPSPPPYDRAKAIREFDETKAGVKGLVDAGIQTIPPFFVHPPDTLSDLTPQPQPQHEIPTIDLSAVHVSRAAVVDQVRRAASTVGFFQVTNHGVSPELLRRTVAAVRAFHEQPAEVRARVYRRDMWTGVSYMSNFDLFQSKAASWRDTLRVWTKFSHPRCEIDVEMSDKREKSEKKQKMKKKLEKKRNIAFVTNHF